MSKIYQALKRAESEKETAREIPQEASASAPVFTDPERGAPLEEGASDLSAPILPPSDLDRRIISLLEPKSAAAEQFKKVRAYLWRLQRKVRTILVTSALPEEGKSFVAVNLAFTLAQGLHEHVLLVDCDLRRPSLHTYFKQKPKKGLANYLTGEEDLSSFLWKTGIPKLTLLPLGRPPSNPSELLASERMKGLIQEIKGRYDDRYIIFDSTPIVSTSEPNVLAPQVDGVILVVRAGKTSRETVSQSIEALNCQNILGIIFNRLEDTPSGYYSYYPYGSDRKGESDHGLDG